MSKILFLFFFINLALASDKDHGALGLNHQNESDLEQLEQDKETFEKSNKDSVLEKERHVSSVKNLKNIKIKRQKAFKIPKSKISIKKKQKRLKLKDIQPPLRSKSYYSSGDEAELEKVINQEIQFLFKLLKQKRTAELTLRLGALYIDKSKLISHKIQINYDQKMQAYQSQKRKTKPILNLKAAQIYNNKSLKLFKDFKENYPNHKRIDEVLFFLGFNFYQLGSEKQAIKYFSELEKRFPKSPYLYESRFQLGEHYFKLKNWNKAFYYHNKVAKNKRGKFYFFSLYKKAWSAYKMNRVSEGLALLEKIIKEGRAVQSSSDTNQMVSFTQEAIGDLVLFYSYSRKKPEQAKSFFLNLLGTDRGWALLKKLAYVYRDMGSFHGVSVLFNELIKRNPSGPEAFAYYQQIVESVQVFGNSEIVKIVEHWVKNYGPGSAWANANKGNGNLLYESFRIQEVMIRGYSLKNHENFEKTKNEKSKHRALSFYHIYFKYYTNSPYLDQMNFFYGELLFDSGKYIQATKAYERVLIGFPQSKYVKPAYINQLLALEKVLPKEANLEKLLGKSKDPIELPGTLKGFMKVANRYVQKFPREKNVPNILYKMAAFYYRFNQLSLSAKYFKQLSEGYPNSKLINEVGRVLLDIYNKNKDYQSLEELAIQFKQNKNIHSELRVEAESVLEQISFKKIQTLAVEKKYQESAVLYEKFAKKTPSSPLAPSSFYNAGLNYEKALNPLKATEMYSAVLTYKEAKYEDIRKNSQKFLAILNEKLGFYKKSAQSYLAFAKKYPKDSKSSDFWYNAGVIFDALGDFGNATYCYKQYLTLSKKEDRYEAFYLIASMYYRKKNWSEAVKYYDQYLKSPTSNKLHLVQASAKIAEIYQIKLKQPRLAKAWHQKTLALYKKLRVGVSYGARSHFYMTQSVYEDFLKVKMPKNPKQQTVAVKEKLDRLQALERALKPVIRYNDGEQILASLSLIGEAKKEMAKFIYYAPVPKGLKKANLKKYKQGINKLIQPYITESLKSYNLVLKKALSLKVYTEWLKRVHKGLSEIQRDGGRFKAFVPKGVLPKILPLQVIDSTGAVIEDSFVSLTRSLKSEVSKQEYSDLVRAIKSKKESLVLDAVSKILNKDPKNIKAINSLALFYILNKRYSLGSLIMNRISSQKVKHSIFLNNQAILDLKNGNLRQALEGLKKAIQKDSSYSIAKVNLGTLFMLLGDYENGYLFYKKSYSKVLKRWSSTDQRRTNLLNNYAVALTYSREYKQAEAMFKHLIKIPSPQAEVLFNYALFLTEKNSEEKKDMALKNLLKAREIIEELAVYSVSVSFKRSLHQLRSQIQRQIKDLKKISSKKT